MRPTRRASSSAVRSGNNEGLRLLFSSKSLIGCVILIGIVLVVLASGDAAGQAPEVKWRVEYYSNYNGTRNPIFGETNLYENAYFREDSGITNQTYIDMLIFFDDGKEVDNLTVWLDDPSDLINWPEDHVQLMTYKNDFLGYLYHLPTHDYSKFEPNASLMLTLSGEYYENDTKYFFNASENFTYIKTFQFEIKNEQKHISHSPISIDFTVSVFIHLDSFYIRAADEYPYSVEIKFNDGKGKYFRENFDIGVYYINCTLGRTNLLNMDEEVFTLTWNVIGYIGDIDLLQTVSFDYIIDDEVTNIHSVWSDYVTWPIGFLIIMVGVFGIMITRHYKRRGK